MQQLLKSRTEKSSIVVAGFLLMVLFLQQVITFPWESRLALALNNALHVPLFFLITLLLWQFFTRFRNYFQDKLLIVIALSGSFLAFTTEILQLMTPRDASLGDVILNHAGIASALFVLVGIQSKGRKPKVYITATLAVFIFLAGFYRVAYIGWLNQQRNEIAPLLLDLGGSENLLKITLRGDWEKVRVNKVEGIGENIELINIRLRSNRNYPGIRLNEPLPDWNNYEALVVETIHENNGPIPVTFRVETRRDRGMDSTVETFITSGNSRLEIPISSLIRKDNGKWPEVRALLLFSSNLQQDREFYLQKISLE